VNATIAADPAEMTTLPERAAAVVSFDVLTVNADPGYVPAEGFVMLPSVIDVDPLTLQLLLAAANETVIVSGDVVADADPVHGLKAAGRVTLGLPRTPNPAGNATVIVSVFFRVPLLVANPTVQLATACADCGVPLKVTPPTLVANTGLATSAPTTTAAMVKTPTAAVDRPRRRGMA
jgi:hypothetical protein